MPNTTKTTTNEDKKYMRYLLRKEKVVGLDREEMYELQSLIQKYGRP